MKKIKKILRVLGLVLLILLASMGVALVPFIPREEPMDKRTNKEMVEEEDENEKL